MTMKLSGQLTLNKPPEEVIETLANPHRVARCLPHLVAWQPRENGFTAVFRADIGGVVEYLSRMTARADIEVHRTAENTVEYRFQGSIARAKYSGTIHVKLEEEDEGRTRVKWTAEVELSKTLQLLSKFINIKDYTDRIVRDVTESIIQCINKQPTNQQ